MAGDWIKMRTNLDTDPRIIVLASTLNLPELHVVGCLWKVWSWADSHTINGNAFCVTDVTLDRFTNVTGFAQALRKVGWLTGNEDGICFPRFEEHNGQTAKKRFETAKRVAKHRNAKSVTSVTQKALPEKRREEKRINTNPLPLLSKQNATLPTEIDTPEMREAWNDWLQFRREKKKPLTPTTIKQNFREFTAWGIPRSIAAIRHTIGRGWIGLKEPEANNHENQSRIPTDDDLKNWNPIDGGLGKR